MLRSSSSWRTRRKNKDGLLTGAPQSPSPERQRIDKWLWHARVVRTRGDAAKLVTGGLVRINGQRIVTPGHPVRIADVVTVALDRSVRILAVQGFSERRGPPAAGQALYRSLG